MLIFQDKDGIICDAYENTTGRTDLTSAEVTDGTFDGWSKGKLLCFKCHVMPNGHVDSFSPAVDSNLIRNFDGTQAVTMHKVGYYNESEKTFYGVPNGNITVFFDNYNGEYSVNRVSDRVTVRFNRLNAQTNITLSIN